MSDLTRIESVFHAALEEAPDSRERLIHELLAGEPELRAEVLALLAAHESSGPFDDMMSALGISLAQSAREESPDALVGQRIGPYALQRLLGHGGMGAVYLAARADGQFTQHVALKLHRSDLAFANRAAQNRLIAERQILARLSHPNIAQLFDGGVTDDGRPYFVMEYVEGERIDSYCDRHRLGLAARLRLFTAVCEAVQYAHRNLIVHRDLKPSNILVTADGKVKLLDFGIAKVLSDEPALEYGVTAPGLRSLTPDYASPEQISGQSVTTASDVYQLGLVLHELLSGRRALHLTSLSLPDVQRSVVSGIRRAPSAALLDAESDAVAGGATSADAIAGARGSTPERLRRQLSGDLDSIVLTAARPEPDARYGSANDLAADIHRYLEGRPVRARRATVLYRASRFVRRNPIALAGATLVLFLTIAYASGLARESRRTARERDRAEEVTRFLTELFVSAEPQVARRGDTLTAREVLDRAAQRIRRELTGNDDLRARLMSVIAHSYGSLDLRKEARALEEEALAIRRKASDPNEQELTRATIALAMTDVQLGDLTSATPLLEEAERLIRRSRMNDTVRGRMLSDVGYAWQISGKLDRAEPLYEQSLKARYTPGDSLSSVVPTLTNLGRLRLARGDGDSAVRLLRTGLAIRRAKLDASDPRIAASLENLASALLQRRDIPAADSAIEEALRIARLTFEPRHSRITGLMYTRAGIVAARGNHAEAERLYREALAFTIERQGERPVQVALMRNDLGSLLKQTGRLAEAESLFRLAVDGYRRQYGAEHEATAITQTNLAWLLASQGRMREADSLYAPAAAALRQKRPDSRTLGNVLVDFGIVRFNAGHKVAAVDLLREALPMLEKTSGVTADQSLRARNMLGRALSSLGEYPEAEQVLLESLRIARTRPAGDPAVFWAASSLVPMYEAWGRKAEADRYRPLATPPKQ